LSQNIILQLQAMVPVSFNLFHEEIACHGLVVRGGTNLLRHHT
jgi:hypothetical protein